MANLNQNRVLENTRNRDEIVRIISVANNKYLTPDERATNAKRLAELIKIENTITSANTTDDQVASFLKNEKIISQATFEEIEPGAMKRGHRANDSDFNQTGFK